MGNYNMSPPLLNCVYRCNKCALRNCIKYSRKNKSICQKMNQNHICQKTTKLLSKNINFITILKDKYILQLQIQKYSSSARCNFKYRNSLTCNSNLLRYNKIRHNFWKIGVNKVCRRLKTTKPREEKGEEKNINVIHKYQQFKPPLTSILSVWGVTGAAAYLASYELGSIAYGLATIPIAILHFDTIKVVCSTFKRDIVFTQRYIRAHLVNQILAAKDLSIGECFEALAQSNTNEVMMYFEKTRWTYKQAEILANKITNYFMSLCYEKGDVVAIMVTNRPEYVTLVLGLAKLGIVSALINTSLKRKALLHSINISDCKALIVSEDMIKELEKIKDKMDPKIQIFQLGGKPSLFKNYINLTDTLIASSDKTPEIIHKVNQSDPLAYIYTSSTTSLPKAAVLSHSKFIMNSIAVTYLLNLGVDDVVYNPLPLYHSTGLIVGVGPSMITGIPVVVCRKFSAAKYWSHCMKYKCTVGQYVGDICRYLLLQPETPYDKTHGVKKMIGSGLNRGTWKAFVKRFNVEVTELYGATEENCRMINIDGKTGAVGFIPSFLPQFLHPASIIEVDANTLEPIRNEDGLCKRTTHALTNKYEKPGMLVGMIRSSTEEPHSNLVNESSEGSNNDQKIIENVFKKGDKAYVTGDILVMDKLGYIYCMNRNEDIYCWKGKTVTAPEVESVIGHLSGHTECAAYGVPIPGMEGKAGMVIIADPEKKIDLQTFAQEIENHLPSFACPVFIRLRSNASLFNVTKRHQREGVDPRKVTKRNYIEEGFDPIKVKDRLYYINRNTGFYEPLTVDVYQNIINKKIIF